LMNQPVGERERGGADAVLAELAVRSAVLDGARAGAKLDLGRDRHAQWQDGALLVGVDHDGRARRDDPFEGSVVRVDRSSGCNVVPVFSTLVRRPGDWKP